MSDASRAALRQALATAGTALVVGSLHVPQPFLAVLAAQLVGGFACPTGRDFFRRIAAAWIGSMTGLFLLVAAPDQQWISLPVFGVATGFGIRESFRRLGPAPAILFAMGIGGMFSSGIVHPAAGLLSGLAHASSLSIAATVSTVAWVVCMGRTKAAPPPADLPSAVIVGLSAISSLLLACLTLPTEAVVMTIATMTTILALQTCGPSPGISERSLGAVGGLLISIAFLIVVSGSGNNLAVFLAALALVMGTFEWLASTNPGRALCFHQAAAIFAVASTMLPRPDQFLTASLGRILAVLLGFAVAVPFFWISEKACARIANPAADPGV